MKGLLFGAALSVLALGTNGAWALEMLPGEWQLGSPMVRIVDKTTGTLIFEEQSNEPPKLSCFTPQRIEELKTLKTGTQISSKNCSTVVTENDNAALTMESHCPVNDNSEGYILVKYRKVSDDEITFSTSVENHSKENIYNGTVTYKQTFISKNCSDKATIAK